MEIKDTIVVAKDFTTTPGARYDSDGTKFSGETFLKKILEPKFNEAVTKNHKIKIILDGVMGYPSSFVSGSFGKLSLERTAKTVLKHIVFESEDNPMRSEKIIYEINHPKKK